MFVLVMYLPLMASDANWLTNYEEALKKAKEEKKPVLINFSGSDWCGWCIRLDKEVFSTGLFSEFARDNVILFVADFPRNKKISDEEKMQNEKLAKKYNIEGFPTVIVIDSNENILLRTGYRPGGAKEYIKHLNENLKK